MERTKRTLKEERTMTTYEIRQPRWSIPEGKESVTLYTFKTGQDFVAYVAIRAKTHESITVRYDKKNDILYVEDWKMAHGPVNRAWYIQITPTWCIKVNEQQYKDAIEYHSDSPITVVIGQRTDRTLYLCNVSAEELQKAGFTQKGNRVWGMLSEIDYDFSE